MPMLKNSNAHKMSAINLRNYREKKRLEREQLATTNNEPPSPLLPEAGPIVLMLVLVCLYLFIKLPLMLVKQWVYLVIMKMIFHYICLMRKKLTDLFE